ncbi:MAG: type II toxin-antitoxin system VapC family toxin [Chloroflexi bacterium]|nr:type II toxin-antitoxin system VapC family toxin [Chloroflexota bacterium]
MYLVDTDWAIDALHGIEPVASRLTVLTSEEVGISIISLAELYEGVFNSTNPAANERAVLDFLTAIPVVNIDDETCRIFARERARLRRIGRLFGDFDLLIAATALRHGLTLLSNNRRHFEQVEGLDIVSV